MFIKVKHRLRFRPAVVVLFLAFWFSGIDQACGQCFTCDNIIDVAGASASGNVSAGCVPSPAGANFGCQGYRIDATTVPTLLPGATIYFSTGNGGACSTGGMSSVFVEIDGDCTPPPAGVGEVSTSGNYSGSFVIPATATEVVIYVCRSTGGGNPNICNITQCGVDISSTTVTPETCAGANDGSITATGVLQGAVVGVLTYSIDGVGGSTANTTGVFTGLAPGAYTVTVYDSGSTNCVGTAMVTVDAAATPTPCSVSGADFVCNNSAGNVYTAPAGMSSYSWGISGSGTITSPTTGSSVTVTAGNYLGNYTVAVTITDANSCSSTCSKISNIFLLTPPANITINPTPACFGATLDLSIVAASSSTVSWTGEGVTNTNGTFNPDGFGGFYNQTTAIPTTTGPHIYGVTVTADNGCSNTGTATVTVHPAPPVCSISGPSSVCSGSTGNVYSAPGGVSGYSWGVSGSGTITSATNGSSVTVTAGGAGTYTVNVTLTDANGCTSTCTQPVNINALPFCSIIGPPPGPGPSNDTLCVGQQYVFTGPPGMSAYQWGVSASCSINGSNTGSSVTVTVNSGTSGSSMAVFVTITDANGCISNCSLSRIVQPAPTCSINGPLTACSGSTGNVYTVTSDAGAFGYYIWSISGDGVITSNPISGFGLTSVSVTAGASGTYTVTVETKFSFNTCLKSCSQTVTIEGCCEFIAGCPTNTGLGTYNCNTLGNIPAMPTTLADLQAPPYNMIIGADPCGPIKFTASDNATPNVCSPSNQTITRTIFVWEDADDDDEYVTDEPSTTCVYTYVVQADLTDPTISCPTAISVQCIGDVPACPANFAAFDALPGASASDNCDNNLTYSCSTGTLVGGACGGTITRTHTVTDDCGNDSSCQQTITVNDNTAPQIVDIANYSLLGCNTAWPNLMTTWTDNCSAGGVIAASAGPVQTNGCSQSRVYTFTVVDGCGNPDTETTTVTRNADAVKPEIVDLANYALPGCNAAWPTTLITTWTDNCSGSGMITATAGTVTASGCTQSRVYTFTKTDGCGNTDVETTTVTRTYDVTKPVFTNVPANVTVQCNNIPPVGAAVATDNCGTPTVVNNLEIRTNGACPDSYTLTRKWTATDACGNTKTATQKITVVDNTKPVFTFVPANLVLECSDPVPPMGTPMASDNCDASVTITELGEVCTYFNCLANRQLKRTWKATDNCGNWTTAVQLIDISDTQKPNFTFVPQHITIECSALFPVTPGTPTATDACDPVVQITFNGQTTTAGSCPQEYIVTRQWTATDDCGNTRTATQTITVEDNTPPVFTNAPANTTVMCGMVPPAPVVTATDNCDNNVPVTYLGEINNGPNCPYTITRTWTVTDDCGNPRTHTQLINVGAAPINGPNGPEGIAGEHVVGRQTDGKSHALTALLMPNPALEEVWVSFEVETEGEATLRLFDVSGRLAVQQSFTAAAGLNNYRLDLSGLSGSGVYTVQLMVGDQRAVERLVVLRK